MRDFDFVAQRIEDAVQLFVDVIDVFIRKIISRVHQQAESGMFDVGEQAGQLVQGRPGRRPHHRRVAGHVGPEVQELEAE